MDLITFYRSFAMVIIYDQILQEESAPIILSADIYYISSADTFFSNLVFAGWKKITL